MTKIKKLMILRKIAIQANTIDQLIIKCDDNEQ